jgi:hypothetical protein
VAPHSRIPVQIARDDAEVAVTDFADYATQFHIQVRVDSSGPLRSFPSSPAASLAFDSENNTNRMGMTTTEIKLLNWPLRNKGMDQFSKWLSSPRKWLNEARLTRGGPGQKNPATWNPVLVAIALIDKGYADLTAIDRFIRSDVSNWVPEWEEKKDQLWG